MSMLEIKTAGWPWTRTVNAGNDTAQGRVEIEGRCLEEEQDRTERKRRWP